ncbi:hypothetical protein HYPDE_29358 [Hyphomicrobium denitrificans 1NES1]|uniref:Uncharacterized protein n=1 Tax=Hyphomicrobium denitrificans 1NES1 TaxID=670307 RepID=N0B5R2_9HYPH|nr:hypothetical protein [Hyphomicrobium denitrificans]AGK57547.1 hypothetical protein HYPDE_29358 [Hyphomicrobium denitrificans 1NES1]
MTGLLPFDVVVIASDFEDEDVRGKRGHIIGEVTPTEVGVFVYDLERVWCLHPNDVRTTGGRDIEAQNYRGPVIRVNRHGEIVD